MCSLFALLLLSITISIEVQGKPGFLSYKDFRGKPYKVSYDKRSFMINGQRSLFLAGSIHYPRGTPCIDNFMVTLIYRYVGLCIRPSC